MRHFDTTPPADLLAGKPASDYFISRDPMEIRVPRLGFLQKEVILNTQSFDSPVDIGDDIDTVRKKSKPTRASGRKSAHPRLTSQLALAKALKSLEDDKAEAVVTIDLDGKSTIADHMVIASGRSTRHVGAIAEHLAERLRGAGVVDVRVEGLPHCDWVLIDSGDVIIHIFRPEVREFYNLEKLWSADRPAERRVG
jgi:ribosome-associated protein